MRLSLKCGILLFGLLHAVYLCAFSVKNMYSVVLECQTQTEEERGVLFQQGLLEVLSRLQPQMKTNTHPFVERALGKIGDYVDQYSYEGNTITIRFNSALVDQLTTETGEAVWGKQRPTLLLWLAIEEAQQRRLIGVETDPLLEKKIMTIVHQKGLPVILPLMDLEDMATVTVADVWGEFPSVLKQASRRYAAQAILIGRVVRKTSEVLDVNERWEGHWELLTVFPSEEEGLWPPKWQVEGPSLEALLSSAMANVAHFLVEQYGVSREKVSSSKEEKAIFIEMSNIVSAEDLFNAETVLRGIEWFKEVSVFQALQNKVIFEVILNRAQDLPALTRRLRLEKHLSAEKEGASLEQEKISLTYRWLPGEEGY